MHVTREAFSARVRFIDTAENTVQSFSRLSSNIGMPQLQELRAAVNQIRRPNHIADKGFYTIQDELKPA